jgi:hypothetical protein
VTLHAIYIRCFSIKNTLHPTRDAAYPAGNRTSRRDTSTELGVEGGDRRNCGKHPSAELVSSHPDPVCDLLADRTKVVQLLADEMSESHGYACLI